MNFGLGPAFFCCLNQLGGIGDPLEAFFWLPCLFANDLLPTASALEQPAFSSAVVAMCSCGGRWLRDRFLTLATSQSP
jgi:hypothetical protein